MPVQDALSGPSVQEVVRSRSGSATSRRISLRTQADSLSAPSQHGSDRRRSVSSTKSGNHRGGSDTTRAHAPPVLDIHKQDRSPYLSRDDESLAESDRSSDSDIDDHLPVTGFAVASNRRNADFHALFPAVDEGDYLIEDYGCALSKDILVQGRLYVSENHVCFHANIFGWVTDVIIPFTEIRAIEKKMTALVIPNAIGLATQKERYTFASFISRDSTYDVLVNIWRLANPAARMPLVSSGPATSRTPSVAETAPMDHDEGSHASTQCACAREGRHYPETALQTLLPSTPEKIYNLMFNSDFFRDFLVNSQNLRDIETSDWRPLRDKLLTRTTSYIKPLTGSIGPKQTKCHIVDEQEHLDFEDFISVITTTRTPDVPSGGVFSVKTRTCFTWAGSNSTRVVVTSVVEWTGKSWVKGIIDKSAIEGQKQYHADLERGMRAYIKNHPTEFGRREGEVEAEIPIAIQPTEASQYAAATRQQRQDQEYSNLQWGFDSVLTGCRAIYSGLKALFETLLDMTAGTVTRDKAIMFLLILVLALSNLYTYFSRPSRPRQELADAIRTLLENAALSPAQPYAMDELGDIHRTLDQVELRVARLRASLPG